MPISLRRRAMSASEGLRDHAEQLFALVGRDVAAIAQALLVIARPARARLRRPGDVRKPGFEIGLVFGFAGRSVGTLERGLILGGLPAVKVETRRRRLPGV